MSNFTFILFWESQISTQNIAISDLGEALIIQGQDTRMISLKIQKVLIILSMICNIMERLVSSKKYGILNIFKYNFN